MNDVFLEIFHFISFNKLLHFLHRLVHLLKIVQKCIINLLGQTIVYNIYIYIYSRKLPVSLTYHRKRRVNLRFRNAQPSSHSDRHVLRLVFGTHVQSHMLLLTIDKLVKTFRYPFLSLSNQEGIKLFFYVW